MRRRVLVGLLLLLPASVAGGPGAAGGGRLVLESAAATLTVERTGGVFSAFRLAGDDVNPLAGMGHFHCLDRWGQPSAAEEKNGMPFHGEAYKVDWRISRAPERRDGALHAEMAATLPIAGLEVRRTIHLRESAALVLVDEQVTNRNRLGRIYNIVQHPTIGGPFLDLETRVDAGAGRGFMQSSPLPNPERPQVRWPGALHGGKAVDIRRLADDPNPNVVSYEVKGELGWTTACNPRRRRLLGYVWRRSDYPWFNAWRHVENGKPALRGLEFGTTGLHQPFPVLVEKGRIFDLPLYTYLDAGESRTRPFAAFLLRTPQGFEGVESVAHRDGRLVVRERGPGRRELSLPAPVLF
jgi:hypothetical protein